MSQEHGFWPPMQKRASRMSLSDFSSLGAPPGPLHPLPRAARPRPTPHATTPPSPRAHELPGGRGAGTQQTVSARTAVVAAGVGALAALAVTSLRSR